MGLDWERSTRQDTNLGCPKRNSTRVVPIVLCIDNSQISPVADAYDDSKTIIIIIIIHQNRMGLGANL